jgi:hypothetical protein
MRVDLTYPSEKFRTRRDGFHSLAPLKHHKHHTDATSTGE